MDTWRNSFGLQACLTGAVLCVGHAALADFTFFDDTFLLQNYSEHREDWSQPHSNLLRHVSSGGNTGDYLSSSQSVPRGLSRQLLFLTNETFRYSPRRLGAIDSIEVEFDTFTEYTQWRGSSAFFFVVKQDGKLFGQWAYNGQPEFYEWTRIHETVNADDLAAFERQPHPFEPHFTGDRPDFSNDAPDLEFGLGFDLGARFGGQTITMGLDNLGVTVRSASGLPSALIDIDPRSTYLRTAAERGPSSANPGQGPQDAQAIVLADVLGTHEITPGDWIALQRVGDFVFTDQEPSQLPDELAGPHADEGRPGTLRNLWAIFSSSGELLEDPTAIDGMKSTPIAESAADFSRVPGAVGPPVGARGIATSPDPFAFRNQVPSQHQPTDLPEDFSIDEGGDLLNPTPILVQVPEGATHLFVGAGDTQWWDNRLTEESHKFGLFIARVSGEILGDITFDGTVDVADASLLLANWGGGGLGDLNLDYHVDAADMGALLSNWTGDHVPQLQVPEAGGSGIMVALSLMLAITFDRRPRVVDWDE